MRYSTFIEIVVVGRHSSRKSTTGYPLSPNPANRFSSGLDFSADELSAVTLMNTGLSDTTETQKNSTLTPNSLSRLLFSLIITDLSYEKQIRYNSLEFRLFRKLRNSEGGLKVVETRARWGVIRSVGCFFVS